MKREEMREKVATYNNYCWGKLYCFIIIHDIYKEIWKFWKIRQNCQFQSIIYIYVPFSETFPTIYIKQKFQLNNFPLQYYTMYIHTYIYI